MLTMEDYNPRRREKIVSFVVRGDTKPFSDSLRLMGGRWNTNLVGGSGWLFSVRQHYDNVSKFVRGVNKVEQVPVVEEFDSLFQYPYLGFLTTLTIGFYVIGGALAFSYRLIG